MHRLRRAVALALAALGTLALAGAVALWIASRTGAVQSWMRARVVGALARALGADVDVASVGGTLGRSLVLRELRVRWDGRTVARVRRVEAIYSAGALLRGRLKLRRLVLDAPEVRAVRAGGRWRLPALGRRGGGGIVVDVARLVAHDGRIAVALRDATPPRQLALAKLELEARLHVDPRATTADVTALRATPRGLAVSPLDAAARVTWSGRRVDVPNARLATARSHLAARGWIEASAAVDLAVALTPLDWREVRALAPASPLARDVHATATARGPWRAIDTAARVALGPGGTLDARATLDLTAAPAAWEARLRFAGLDPGAAVAGLPRARATGHARARGHGAGRTAPIAYGLVLARSELGGRALDRLVVRGAGARGVHHARGRLRHAAGDARVRTALALARVPVYRAAARVDVRALGALVPALPGSGRLRAAVAGRGVNAADRTARVRATLTDASVRGLALATGRLEADLDGARGRIAAALAGPALASEAHGAVDLATRATSGTLTLRADLAALGERFGAALRGRVTADAEVAGRLEALAVTARAVMEGPAWRRLSAERATLTLDGRDVGAPAGTVALRVEAPGARLGDSAPYAASAALDWRRAADGDRTDLVVAARPGEGAGHRLVARVERTGTTALAEVRELALALPGGPPWSLGQPARLRVAAGALHTDGVVLGAAEQRVTLAGRVALRAGASPSAATVEAARVRLAPLCLVAAARPCAGVASGRLALAGDAAAPRLDAVLTASALRVDPVDYGAVELAARYADRAATVHATLAHPAAGTLAVDGTVPIDLAWAGGHPDLAGAPLDLRVHAARLDLTFLTAVARGELRESAGRLGLDLRVTGPRRAPHLDGSLALDDGRLTLAAAGVPWEDVRLRVAAAEGVLEVTTLHARGGDGTLDGAGRLGLTGGAAGAIGLRIAMDRFFAVRRPGYEATVSGALALEGTLFAPAITGTVDVDHAVVHPAALPASGPSLQPDPTITVVGAPEHPAAEAESPATSLGRPMRLDVTVHVARNAWIRRNDADIEVRGDVHLAKAPGESVRLGGTIELVRGWYAFQGRRFELEEGTIRFTGASPPRPIFDVSAVYRTLEYRITVRITGPADKPELVLTADPPLEQADILAVLLFGKPTSQLGRREAVGLQQQALSLAAGYAVPEMRTSVMNTLGLDTLDVALPQGGEAPGTTARERAGRVSVGRYVAPDIFVSLGQEFGARTAQVASVEYGVTPRISLRGSTTTRGDSALDVFWHRRY